MRRLAITALALVAGIGAVVFATGATDAGGYRILAIFDNANQVTVGEQVRVAGVTVGVIEKLDVTNDNKAALTLRIDDPGYQDFRSDSHCIIRPQSLIGEQFVDCTPTRPRAAGAPVAPPLTKIDSGQGEGDYLMPVQNTSSPVGIDLINNIMRVPERQRFGLILNEFGVTLAGNGAQLNDVIRRAYPGLQETNKVLSILASQNKLLADLAVKSDHSLGPLARERKSISSLINSSEKVGRATAEEGQNLQKQWALFPEFLRQLTPTMNDLNSFSQAFGGFIEPLSTKTSQINSIVEDFPALAANSTTAINSLAATTAQQSLDTFTRADVQKSIMVAGKLAEGLNPFANGLGGLLQSLQRQGGWQFLMQTLYFQTAAVNGYNKYGHYARGELAINGFATCALPQAGRTIDYLACSANFDHGLGAGAASAARASASLRRLAGTIGLAFGQGRTPTGRGTGSGSPSRGRVPTAKVPTTTPASPTTTPTTTEAKPGSGGTPEAGGQSGQAADSSSAKAAMLNYLTGGAGR